MTYFASLARIAPAAALAFCALGGGCSATPDLPSETPGTLVIGVLDQPALASLIANYRIVTTVDGVESGREVVAPSELPREVRLTAPASDLTATVTVSIEGFTQPVLPTRAAGAAETPAVTKLATTRFVRGETRLLRLRLEAQCVTGVLGFYGPVCTAPQSCNQGRCVDGTFLASDLEPYSAEWAADGPDVCKPAGAGAPEVIVGTGQTDYGPMTANETIEPERGPQGGHHLWIAVRMKNLKQTGSTTTITGVQPDTGLAVPPTSFVFTYDRDEGGYCKIFGLRYQLDNASNPVEKFLGHPLDVTVDVKDVTGAKASATVHINVATTIKG